MLDFSGLNQENDQDMEPIISGVMPKIYFTSAQSLDQIKDEHQDGFNKCETDRCLLDLALLVYFKHQGEDMQTRERFHSIFKKRGLVTSQTDTRRNQQDDSNLVLGLGDERIRQLLPMIFDDVEQKNWSVMFDNSNIDTSIALEFLSEYFSP